MTNKIVILNDSVTLFQHYIGDDKWETVMAFPRNGLTYTIQNNGIRFFAFEDYFYRNLIISMELPLYIVDKAVGIEGEFSDIELITSILDRIFVQSDGEADLSLYLKKLEAQETYQPIGDYVTIDEIDELLDDYYTKDETDDLLDEKLDASAYTPVDLSDYYTKDESDSRFQPIGDYLTEHQPLKTINGNVISGTGNIEITCSGSTITVDNELSLISTNPVQNKVITGALMDKLDASAYTPTDLSNYVTISELTQYLTNLQQQINSLAASISGCCGETGETQYRWVTMVGENDYACSGTTKMTKEKQQSSTDGITWTDTGQYRTGSSVLEYNSADCGYVPPMTGTISTMTYKATSGTTERIVASPVELTSLQVQLTAGTYTDIDISGGAGIYATFSYTSNNASGRCSHSTNQISHSAFWKTPLTSINVGSGITYLDSEAFTNCDYLETITLPSTITGMSWSSIIDCDVLRSVTINAATPPDIISQGTSVYLFKDCPLLTEIKVPANSVDAYKNNSKWNRYSSIIKSI